MAITDPSRARALEAELARELVAAHSLFGVPVTAIGLGGSGDDVLFRLLDGTERLALVHLTWRSSAEPPPWPHTTLFADETDWNARKLEAEFDHL